MEEKRKNTSLVSRIILITFVVILITVFVGSLFITLITEGSFESIDHFLNNFLGYLRLLSLLALVMGGMNIIVFTLAAGMKKLENWMNRKRK